MNNFYTAALAVSTASRGGHVSNNDMYGECSVHTEKGVHSDGGWGRGFVKSSPEGAIPEMRLEGRTVMVNKQRKGGHSRQGGLRWKEAKLEGCFWYSRNDRW